jgi:hypothetical protein
MTSDFKPGKAYLIKGKDIRQVKKEIKDWLAQNDIEQINEGEDLIEAHAYGFFYYYDFYFLVKLVENPEGTLVVFSDKVTNRIVLSPVTTARKFLPDKREDMIRFLNGKKELEIDLSSYGKIVNLTSAPIVIIGILLFYYIDLYLFLLIFIPIVVFVSIYQYSLSRQITKNKNLPEYKVEEYKGEIDS